VVGAGVRVTGVPVGATAVPVAVIVPVGVKGGVPGGRVVTVAVTVLVGVIGGVPVVVTVAVAVTVAVPVTVAVGVSGVVAVAGKDAVGVTVAVITGVVVSGAVVVNGVLTGSVPTGSVVVLGVLPINVTGIMGGRSMRRPPSGRTWITQPATRKSNAMVASVMGSVSRFMKPPLAINSRSSDKLQDHLTIKVMQRKVRVEGKAQRAFVNLPTLLHTQKKATRSQPVRYRRLGCRSRTGCERALALFITTK
jgi:hypothetical protein